MQKQNGQPYGGSPVIRREGISNIKAPLATKTSFATFLLLLILSLLLIIVATALFLPQILERSNVQYGPHLRALESFHNADGPPVVIPSLANAASTRGKSMHIVFSTSCSAFQDWQSYAFFYHAWKVRQPGTVTRIITGCNARKEQEVREQFQQQVQILSEHFFLYFTPDFSELNKGNYQTTKYFNKPFGVRSWLESEIGFPNVGRELEDSIFVIMDPDMVLTKPLVNSFSIKDVMLDPAPSTRTKDPIHVTHGSPFAARYGYGPGWLTGIKSNLTHVVGTNSPLHELAIKDAADFYAIGPPYMATGKDMYNIVSHWAEFTPRVYDIHHQFLSEMFGFSCAAAHLKLPHTVFDGLMLSDVGAREEAWGFLKAIPRSDVCKPLPREIVPPVMHYCQRYALGRWFFGKYKLKENFFTCDAPLLRVPPEDIAERYDYFIYPNKERTDYLLKSEEIRIKGNGFATCFLIHAMNEAGEHFRRKHCPKGAANFNKSFIFHDIPENLLYAIEEKT